MSTLPPTGSAWGELPAPPPALPPPPPGEPPPIGGGPKGLPAVTWNIWEALLIGLVTNIVLAQTVVGVIAYLVLGVTSTDDPNTVYVGVIVDLAWFGFMILWLARRHPGWMAQLGIPSIARGSATRGTASSPGLLLYPLIAFVVGLPLTIFFSAISGNEATTPTSSRRT